MGTKLLRFIPEFNLTKSFIKPVTKWAVWGTALTASLGVLWQVVPFIWQLPENQVQNLPQYPSLTEKDRAELINTYRDTLLRNLIGSIGTVATITGGIVLYLNFRNANKNTKLAAERLDMDSKKILKEAELAESRLTAERFSRAIEQIGSENIHVRLGGIYSLEQIAKDSPDDHWTVIEVLTAFIRENSPAEQRRLQRQTLAASYLSNQEGNLNENNGLSIVTTDIQAALTVIGRRRLMKEDGTCNDKGKLELNNTNLSGANLYKANLNNANLFGANLSGTSLNKANLSSANLFGANLRESYLIKANLSGTNLSGAKLLDANLNEVKLGGSNLSNADLSNADLSNAGLSKAYLRSANLDGTSLFESNLRGANLLWINLSGADLTSADLFETNLKEARNWSDDQLSQALLCQTKLPEGSKLNPDRDCK